MKALTPIRKPRKYSENATKSPSRNKQSMLSVTSCYSPRKKSMPKRKKSNNKGNKLSVSYNQITLNDTKRYTFNRPVAKSSEKPSRPKTIFRIPQPVRSKNPKSKKPVPYTVNK